MTPLAPEPNELGAIDWAIRAGDLETVLAWAEAAQGVAARRFALDRLERALLWADPGTVASGLREGVRERLRALEVSASVLDASEALLPPHAVRVPFVLRAAGEQRALVRAVMVAYDASLDAHSGWRLTATAERAVREAIRLAAREATPVVPIERLRLVPVSPAALEGVEIDGPSLGAASYLSALALFSGRRVRSSFAVTGALQGRALVHIEGLLAKQRATLDRGLTLVAPSVDVVGPDALVEGAADVEALAAIVLEPSAPDVDLEAEVRAAARASESGWNGYRWPAVREVITRALARVPARRAELRMELLARLAATERHLGRTTESLRCITEGEQIEKSPVARIAVPDEPRARLARQKAMTLLQALAIPAALRAARRSVAIARRARLRGELILSLGAEGLCALAAGSPERAVDVFAEALAHTMEHRPSNAARSRAYLIEALGHAGDARGAAAQYRLAIREAEEDARRGPDGKLAWVRTSYASALHALGKHEKVLEVLEHPSVITAIAETPLPGLRARRYLGLARLALARTERARDEAHALLESSPGAYDGLEPALRTTAHVNVLWSLHARVTRGQDVPQSRLDASLSELPRVRAIVVAGEAIARARDAETRRGLLAALLTKLERI